MSSSEQESSLAPWLPMLHRYRDAIEDRSTDTSNKTGEALVVATEVTAEPVESCETINSSGTKQEMDLESPTLVETSQSEILVNNDNQDALVSTPIDSEPVVERRLSAEPAEPAEMDNKPSLPSVVHLPIDPILKRLQRVKSFVLGIASIGATDVALRHSIVSNLVSRCTEKTDRKAILVSIHSSDENEMVGSTNHVRYQEAFWKAYGESKAASKIWHAQLGDLPRWKQDFGLIVLDLGDASSSQMLRVARLCDGIALQLHDPTDSRAMIQSLKSLTKENLPILGAWSVGLNSRKMAA